MNEEGNGTITRSRVVAVLLAVFLGSLGLHKFYLGRPKQGIVMIALTLTIVGSLITWMWSWVNAVQYMVMSQSGWERYAPTGQVSKAFHWALIALGSVFGLLVLLTLIGAIIEWTATPEQRAAWASATATVEAREAIDQARAVAERQQTSRRLSDEYVRPTLTPTPWEKNSSAKSAPSSSGSSLKAKNFVPEAYAEYCVTDDGLHAPFVLIAAMAVAEFAHLGVELTGDSLHEKRMKTPTGPRGQISVRSRQPSQGEDWLFTAQTEYESVFCTVKDVRWTWYEGLTFSVSLRRDGSVDLERLGR